MWNTLYDLEAAEAHWNELRTEAAHERLARIALKERTAISQPAPLRRLIERLRGERPHDTDPNKN
ncbi:MAG: hypothetical protein AB4911_16790 [Oscillochloridaceae bacterium umkhey_bin13]